MTKYNFLGDWWRYFLKSRKKSPLLSLWLEFWLPLPLIGISIWLGGKSIANQMLSYSYDTSVYLGFAEKVVKKQQKK
jgi:hypothetical protein